MSLALFTAFVISPSAHALSAQEIYDKAGSSVVVIKTYDQKGLPLGQGSGFILNSTSADSPAFLVTNFHVIKSAGDVLFKFGGKWKKAGARYRVEISKDLAIYRLDFAVAGLALARGEARVGEEIVVIGSPEGLENSVSPGIVSGIREIAGRKLMQTTAPVAHGSSGGPMLDKSGAVVGVMVSMHTEAQNVNFAIPAAEVLTLLTNAESSTGTKNSGLTEWSAAVNEAWALIIADRYGEAGKLLEDHLESHPDDDEAWYKLGYVKGKLGSTDDGIRCYREALRINPERYDFWNDLGATYGELGRTNDAVAAYQEALRINPECASAWYNLGVAYAKLGRTNDAIAAYREALRINSEYADAWYNLGLTYGDLGQTNDEIAAYREALRIDPEYAVAWCNLGVSYGKLKRTSDANTAFHEVLRIDPEYAKAWFGLGIVYCIVNDLTAARHCLFRLERLDTDLAQELRNVMYRMR